MSEYEHVIIKVLLTLQLGIWKVLKKPKNLAK